VLAQAALFAIAWLSGNFWGYFVFWLLPLVTIVKVLGYLRITAEHGSPKILATGTAALRSFCHHPLSTMLLGPFGFAQHAEHHARPEIAYQKLPAVQITDAKIEFIDGSHFHYWAKTLKGLPWVHNGMIK
jgi:fatty acid desaturase